MTADRRVTDTKPHWFESHEEKDDVAFSRLTEKFTEKIDDVLGAIKTIDDKVTYTNGKVGELVKWRERVTGGAVVAGVIGLPILIWSVLVLRDLPKEIKMAVKDEITSKYEVQINK